MVIGATGGLRTALESGAVAAATVAAFEAALAAKLGAIAHFQILSGDDEASAELHAARYIGGKQGVDVGYVSSPPSSRRPLTTGPTRFRPPEAPSASSPAAA